MWIATMVRGNTYFSLFTVAITCAGAGLFATGLYEVKTVPAAYKSTYPTAPHTSGKTHENLALPGGNTLYPPQMQQKPVPQKKLTRQERKAKRKAEFIKRWNAMTPEQQAAYRLKHPKKKLPPAKQAQ